MPLHELLQAQLQNTRLINDLANAHGESKGRITALEHRMDRSEDREHSKTPPVSWTPRDWMMAGSGIMIVLATLSEKIGWTTAVGAIVRLYGGK